MILAEEETQGTSMDSADYDTFNQNDDLDDGIAAGQMEWELETDVELQD